MSIISNLVSNQIDNEYAAKLALTDKNILAELLTGIQSTEDQIRFNSFKTILIISEHYPEILYPKWSFFETMFSSDNSYFKLIAIQIIANLTKIDTEKRFEKLFDKYFIELNTEKTMIAAHIAGNAGKIAKAKPGLQSKITDILINIDCIYKGKQIDLIKGYAIAAFDQYLDKTGIKEKECILEFVKKEQYNRSPRTAKIVKEFINKWGQ